MPIEKPLKRKLKEIVIYRHGNKSPYDYVIISVINPHVVSGQSGFEPGSTEVTGKVNDQAYIKLVCIVSVKSRIQLSAHWWGFHDPHSRLSHYEWRAGTTPGSDDILPSTRIELSEEALIFLSESDQLPTSTDIYITVRAYNPLGMWSEATSNGFRVDFSPPDAVEGPTVDETVGVAVKNTQVKTPEKIILIKNVIKQETFFFYHLSYFKIFHILHCCLQKYLHMQYCWFESNSQASFFI